MHESHTNSLGCTHSTQIAVLWDLHNEALLWFHIDCINNFILYIPTAVWISGHGAMLSLLVLPDYSPLLLIRVPSCSKLQLFRCPCCAHPDFWYQYQICLHKILRVLETFLGIRVEEEGFLVQYPEHIAPTPVHILTCKTVFTASAKWSFWSHSVLTSLSISSLNSYLFTPFLSFISESPVFPVELPFHLAFSFLNKNGCWKEAPLPPRMTLWGSSFDDDY